MGLCWYCHWGWPKKIREIHEKYCEEVGWDAMHFGPAHVVWEDENFDSAEECLADGEKWRHDLTDEEYNGVRESLKELAALPMELRRPPPGYEADDDDPAKYPPPPDWECSNAK